jgi:spoIIIJ-associated protein
MLYEDDFEFEEQPADIRDRAIPGKGGGSGDGRGRGGNGYGNRRRRGNGGGDQRRRGGPPPRTGAPSPNASREFPEEAQPARDLLREMLELMGVGQLDLHYIARPEGEYFEVTGPDLGMLIGRHGNTLEALNLVFNNMLNAGVRNNRRYYTIDAEGYRARRADQLSDLALATAERVLRDGKPHKLEPMLPSERKIVHLAIADNPGVRTESEGEEPERCVVIHPTE